MALARPISLAGGSPVRVTSVERGVEYSGAWSPDGSQFVYLQVRADQMSLMILRTSGDATPTQLRDKAGHGLPTRSPGGDWIEKSAAISGCCRASAHRSG